MIGIRAGTVAAIIALAGCKEQGEAPSPKPGPSSPVALPLSPGMQLASSRSGGIAGIFESLQISHDWQLIRISENGNEIRRMSAEEQKAVHSALLPFGQLNLSQSDDFPDGFSSSLVARGRGKGAATPDQIKALRKVLGELGGGP